MNIHINIYIYIIENYQHSRKLCSTRNSYKHVKLLYGKYPTFKVCATI